MRAITGNHPAVSAHGPRAGTIDAYVHALKTGAEYVEFDIRRTVDGELSVAAVKTRFPEVPAALSLGRDLAA